MKGFSQVKVGDIVRWKAHEDWDDGGLGTVVGSQPTGFESVEFKIMWYAEIKDITGYTGDWYDLATINDDEVEVL